MGPCYPWFDPFFFPWCDDDLEHDGRREEALIHEDEDTYDPERKPSDPR